MRVIESATSTTRVHTLLASVRERTARMHPLGRLPLRFAAVLSLFLFPWPGIGTLFADVFSACVNFVAAGLTQPALLRFGAAGPPDDWSAVVTLIGTSGARQDFLWELRRAPFLPLAVFAALTLALPRGRFRSRLAVFALGTAVIMTLPALRLGLLLGSDTPFRALDLSPTLMAALTVATGTLVLPPGMAYAVPALLLLLLLTIFDRTTLARLSRATSSESDGAASLERAVASLSHVSAKRIRRPRRRGKRRR
jgi:hypothetical protein